MKVSLSWLEQYVDVDLAPAALADKLTMAGLEVEAVADRFAYLNSVIVGRITAVEDHPRSDHLKICRVDAGDGGRTVICGAPNAAVGMLSALALPGTEMPAGGRVEKSPIRGTVSDGMLCSARELGIGTDADGILELNPQATVGQPLNRTLDLSDPVFDIGLTPNRADCLSIIGVAREVAALQGKSLCYPRPTAATAAEEAQAQTSVEIQAPDLCPRYAARLIFDVSVEPSPFWLQDRLRSVGLKPINNIVDITNFVMLETGQPLHAFDFDRLEEGRIVVRAAADGEDFTTLDGKPRRLESGMTLICDGRRPVALGGVMGGLNSEIETTTRRVLLESACFNPISIRRTAKALGLGTDASYRFERGVDPHGTLRSLDRAAVLIAELGSGRLLSGRIDAHPNPSPIRGIALNVDTANRLLGTRMSLQEMVDHLTAIEFEVVPRDENNLQVTVPSFRVDVSRCEDLNEELARLYGYDRVATTFPAIPAAGAGLPDRIRIRRRIREWMCSAGFSEAICYSFIGEDGADRLGLAPHDRRRRAVRILNPLSEEQAVMRTTLLPGLIETLRRNLLLQNRNLRLFEIGNVFFDTGHPDRQPQETEMLAGLWTGSRSRASWLGKPQPCDFYDLKGALENLLIGLDLPPAEFTRPEPGDCLHLRPGHTAVVRVAGEPIGHIGEIDPQVLAAYDLDQATFAFELDAEHLIRNSPPLRQSRPLPRYPSVARDVTLIIPTPIEAARMLNFVAGLDEPLVESLELFDVYAGDPIPKGRKSISFRIVYRSGQATLEDEAVNRLHRSITDRVVQHFDAGLPA